MPDITFEQFWEDCIALAATTRQIEIMYKTKNLYHDYWEEGKSVAEAMRQEWG